MKECKIKLEENFIFKEPSFYIVNDIFTNIGYSEKEDKFVLIKKYQHKLKICKNLISHAEINNLEFILSIQDIVIDDDLYIIQDMDDFIPLKLFLEESNKNIDFIYNLMTKLISINLESNFFQNISGFIDIDTLWIDKDFNINICWLTFVIKYQNYFDNSIFKTNVNTTEGIVNLFNYNKKRLQKRPSKNIPSTPAQLKHDSAENFFKYLTPKIKPQGPIQYNEKISTIDKGSVRVCGTKKLCIENIKGFCKSREDKKLDFSGVKLILLKIIFKNENVTSNNLDIFISKLREIHKSKSCEIFNLSDKLTEVIKFIIEDFNDFKEPINNAPNEIVIKFLTNLKKFAEKEASNMILENENNLEPLENIFEEKGFNMADFNTKSYKKGRFYVCQAVPNLLAKSRKPNVDLNKIFQIIEIQNRQIEMMYQTLKEKNNIDHLIDAQLESLSLQANEMLTDLDKNEE